MEQETKRTDGVGQGSGLVPGVLGEVGAGAIPGVLPVQRGGEGVSDTLPPRAAEALCNARHNVTPSRKLEYLADEMAEAERELAEARQWATELANALDGMGYPDRIQMEAFRQVEQGWKGGA
jgi:hypothetical protein